jgi:hypothetical protein
MHASWFCELPAATIQLRLVSVPYTRHESRQRIRRAIGAVSFCVVKLRQNGLVRSATVSSVSWSAVGLGWPARRAA